jgi:hypothetical protein
MKPVLTFVCFAAFLFSGKSRAHAQTPTPAPGLPTWKDEIAKGCLPYHQLMVEDFGVSDDAKGDGDFYVSTCIEPRYHYYVKPHAGWVYAYISDWIVFSGFNRSESWRKSSFHEMKAALPYAQALLDISEIRGRELGTTKVGDLPEGRGASYEAAKAELDRKIKTFCKEKYKQVQAEEDAFAKATKFGQNKKKTRELIAEVKKRLAAIPNPSPAPNESSATPTVQPSPSVTPGASVSR